MYCIIVKSEVKEGAREQFLEAMLPNAEASVRDEEGCLVFDVIEDQDDPNTFYLYEIYTSPEALQTHKTMSHYKDSRAVVNELLDSQTVIKADVIAMNPKHR